MQPYQSKKYFCIPFENPLTQNSFRLQPMLKKKRIAREKLDFIIAFGEALCSLDTSVELLQIQNIADQVKGEVWN